MIAVVSEPPSTLGPRPEPPAAEDIRRRVFAGLFGSTPAASEEPPTHRGAEHRHPPERLGRFSILEELGRGGMGIVYKAYDPELNRQIALKVLKAEGGDAASIRAGTARLQREAQSLARLNHPNVVTVHEVGVWNDCVFIAMEWVDGQTLRAWLREVRTRASIVSCFRQAADGLAAAHHAGLVHRDFKPDNVMVGRDGRVRVMDFGLARDARAETSDTWTSVSEQEGSDPLSTLWTKRGVVVGTPAYMAPEQHRGEDAGPHSDQFAFFVALHEALFRERPFGGRTYPELAENVCRGIRTRVASGGRPLWLWRIVERGLAPRPEDRFPSMDAVARALSAPRWKMGGREISVASLVIVAALGWGLSRFHAPCEDVAHQLDGVWDASRRAALADVLQASDRPFAVTVWASTDALLDRYAKQWRGASSELCGVRLVGSAPRPQLEARARCLDDRRDELRVLTEELLGGGDGVLLEAVQGAAMLSDLRSCSDARRLSTQESRVAPEVRQQLVKARVAMALGRYGEAVPLTSSVLDSALMHSDEALRAEALMLRGELEERLGNIPAAEGFLQESLEVAESCAAHEVRAAALIRLVYLAGTRGRSAEATDYAARAHAVLDVLGSPELLRAQLQANLGIAKRRDGDLEEALSLYEEALQVFGAQYGELHPATAKVQANMGTVLSQMGRHELADETLRRAISSFEATLGAKHPWVATALGSLAVELAGQERFQEASQLQRQALDIRLSQFAPDHPSISRAYYNLARIESRRGAYELAERALLQGKATLDSGEPLPDRTQAQWDLLEGTIAFHRGRFEQAELALGAGLEKAPALESLEISMYRWTILAQRDIAEALRLASTAATDSALDPGTSEYFRAWFAILASAQDLVTRP